MSCSPFDLSDYFLEELPAGERAQVEAHVQGCPGCREEVERLQLTGAALFALRDEEIPQRIAFVSDQIFEPSPVRRWLSGFWGSTARLGFASAAMLSAAIVFFAATRPAAPVAGPGPAAVTVAAATPTQAQIEQQVQKAVAKAVAEVEARQAENTKLLVAEFEHRNEEALRSIRWAAGELEAAHKRAQVSRVMAMVQPAEGEVK